MKREILLLRKICKSKFYSILITDGFDETALIRSVKKVAIERILKALGPVSCFTMAKDC